MGKDHNERLLSFIERTAEAIEKDQPPDSALLSELEELRYVFESLGGHSEDEENAPPRVIDPGLVHATEAYMSVCDYLEEALIGRDGEMIEQAETSLERARAVLGAAAVASQQAFFSSALP